MSYSCESFIDFCDRMTIAEEGKTKLRESTERSNSKIDKAMNKYYNSDTTKKQIKALKKALNEVNKSISIISKIEETKWDKAGSVINNVIGTVGSVASLFLAIKSGSLIGGSLIGGVGSKLSSKFFDEATKSSKRAFLRKLYSIKRQIERELAYLEKEDK